MPREGALNSKCPLVIGFNDSVFKGTPQSTTEREGCLLSCLRSAAQLRLWVPHDHRVNAKGVTRVPETSLWSRWSPSTQTAGTSPGASACKCPLDVGMGHLTPQQGTRGHCRNKTQKIPLLRLSNSQAPFSVMLWVLTYKSSPGYLPPLDPTERAGPRSSQFGARK